MPQGKVENVPDDGLTTRQRRTQPVLAVHTGLGKGKSTAAFGMALRAWSAGWSIGVFQFVKSPKWKVGEEKAFRALGEAGKNTVDWFKMGEGWSWLARPGDERDHAAEAAEGWAQIKRDLAAQTYDFYVLDEFTYPMHWGWVSTEEVVETLRARPGGHVVITGRYAKDELMDAADLVTEMGKTKHPMDAGRKGQRGIEW
ncbi:cob(I)yrinic acid a,c-diamide adenosyltransferase [Longispora albida]|uniref:cob(I)yrinic acid a,c-diamide adenosyltransferase n=1 Tax=Longispora albida TaxID=203523 RepID=UPI0003651621|nr:cob(I)yrinic acid a,c-diamide adenosyltransferase [Longispora albida]